MTIDKIHLILESYDSVVLEEFKKEKNKRDVEKAKKSYQNIKTMRKNLIRILGWLF